MLRSTASSTRIIARSITRAPRTSQAGSTPASSRLKRTFTKCRLLPGGPWAWHRNRHAHLCARPQVNDQSGRCRAHSMCTECDRVALCDRLSACQLDDDVHRMAHEQRARATGSRNNKVRHSFLHASLVYCILTGQGSNDESYYYSQLGLLQILVNDLARANATMQKYFSTLYQNQVGASGEQVR